MTQKKSRKAAETLKSINVIATLREINFKF